MNPDEFEMRLAARLRNDAQSGVRPFDAIEIARRAMAAGGNGVVRRGRARMPVWFRSVVLAALLVGLLVAAAFVGGYLRLPGPDVEATPTATAVASSPSFSPAPSADPSTSIGPSLSPSATPSAAPSPSPSAPPSPSASASPSPSPSPTPTLVPSPSPTAPPATGWREVDFPGDERRLNFSSTAERDGIFVAVGDVDTAEPNGRSWRSTDGINWTRGEDTGFGGNLVVATDDAFIAIGSLGGERRVWRSTDGTAWTLLPASPVLEFVNDVAYADGLLVAVGTSADFDAARVWTSADGVTWTAATPPEASSELTRVALRGGDIVAVGDDFGGYGRRLWVLPAGAAGWQQVDVFGEDVDGRLLDLATNGAQFVAVGYQDVDVDRLPVVLSSINLVDWSHTIVPADDEVVFDQVVALPDLRFVAIASGRGFTVGECQPDACVAFDETASAWVSSDALSWQLSGQIYERHESLPPEIGDEIGHPRAVAAGAAGVVVLDRWIEAAHAFFAPLVAFAE